MTWQVEESPVEPLVIFDCDGVLVDSEGPSTSVLAQVMREAGLSVTDSEALTMFKGRPIGACIDMISTFTGLAYPATFESTLRGRIAAVFQRELAAIPHVYDVVANLTERSCVASNGPVDKIELVLGLTGLLPFFKDAIFSAHMIGRYKPEPDLFVYAATAMAVDTAHCIVVEDSIIGVKAARSAGMRVLWYNAGRSSLGYDEGALCFGDMRQLPALLARMKWALNR